MEKNSSSNWNWIVCNLPLKQFVNSETITWSLQPSITLSHPSGEGPDPQIKILLDQEKSFQFTEELGWNWHKSWKLPTISLTLDVTDSEKGDALLCPKDIYVHIFAVKALVDSNNKLCLVDVGLRGNNKMELVDGKAIFQTLKFASTSYNNEGVKFHLLICIYLQISEDTKPKILKAIVSPPIFVDSRKSVRDNDKLSENRLVIYVEPFYPDNFTRKFVKKETKKKESIEEEIQNTVDGLHCYLTAPNIRNKVKHPIFLSVRFSSCISLYYNPNLVTEEDKDNMVEFFQSILLEDIEQGQDLNETKIQDSFFALLINKNSLEDKLKKKKILEILSPVKCKSLSVVFNKAEVPVNFVQVQDLRWLMELYSKSYSKLLLKSKHCLRGGDDENDEEDGPIDRIPPPEKQTIPFITEGNARTQTDWSKYFDTSVYEESAQKKLKTEDPTVPPINMETRTLSYNSMSKMFPSQAQGNPAHGGNPMMGFPGVKTGMGGFPGKGIPETMPGRDLMGGAGMPGLGVGMPSAGMGRLGGNRNMGMGMEQQMMMMNKFNQMNYLNMMNQMGRGGQQFGGMNQFYPMMGGKDGDMMGGQMSAERMQAMMQYQQMLARGEVKTENTDINVKVQGDEEEDDGRSMNQRNRRTNDINVKDEESVN